MIGSQRVKPVQGGHGEAVRKTIADRDEPGARPWLAASPDHELADDRDAVFFVDGDGHGFTGVGFLPSQRFFGAGERAPLGGGEVAGVHVAELAVGGVDSDEVRWEPDPVSRTVVVW